MTHYRIIWEDKRGRSSPIDFADRKTAMRAYDRLKAAEKVDWITMYRVDITPICSSRRNPKAPDILPLIA